MCLKLIKIIVVIGCLFVFISGCATTNTANFKLPVVPQITEDVAIGRVYVGPFIDKRKADKFDTTILGTVRGGYGNPLSRIRDEGGADGFVRGQVINAARKCMILADRKPDAIVISRNNNTWNIDDPVSSDRLILAGVINQLNVETGWSRGTRVNISLDLIDSSTGSVIWNSDLSGQDSGGFGSGIFESATALKQWLGDTIEKAASTVFTSSGFVNALKKK